MPSQWRQVCKACGRPDYWNFDVPDTLWAAIVPNELQNRVVCLQCFDAFALERGVKYAASLTAICFAGEMAALELAVARASDRP